MTRDRKASEPMVRAFDVYASSCHIIIRALHNSLKLYASLAVGVFFSNTPKLNCHSFEPLDWES